MSSVPTTCPKGHRHTWPGQGAVQSGTARVKIEACERICGFCKKPSKSAAILRQHTRNHLTGSVDFKLERIPAGARGRQTLALADSLTAASKTPESSSPLSTRSSTPSNSSEEQTSDVVDMINNVAMANNVQEPNHTTRLDQAESSKTLKRKSRLEREIEDMQRANAAVNYDGKRKR